MGKNPCKFAKRERMKCMNSLDKMPKKSKEKAKKKERQTFKRWTLQLLKEFLDRETE
jgi:hypothetical protein